MVRAAIEHVGAMRGNRDDFDWAIGKRWNRVAGASRYLLALCWYASNESPTRPAVAGVGTAIGLQRDGDVLTDMLAALLRHAVASEDMDLISAALLEVQGVAHETIDDVQVSSLSMFACLACVWVSFGVGMVGVGVES